MLGLGHTGRYFGKLPSELLKIEDEVLALDFNLAIGLRLLDFDNKKDEANKKFWRQLLGGKTEDDSVLGASEIHELIRNDSFADENTRIS